MKLVYILSWSLKADCDVKTFQILGEFQNDDLNLQI